MDVGIIWHKLWDIACIAAGVFQFRELISSVFSRNHIECARRQGTQQAAITLKASSEHGSHTNES